jgi:hypothetical protein
MLYLKQAEAEAVVAILSKHCGVIADCYSCGEFLRQVTSAGLEKRWQFGGFHGLEIYLAEGLELSWEDWLPSLRGLKPHELACLERARMEIAALAARIIDVPHTATPRSRLSALAD